MAVILSYGGTYGSRMQVQRVYEFYQILGWPVFGAKYNQNFEIDAYMPNFDKRNQKRNQKQNKGHRKNL